MDPIERHPLIEAKVARAQVKFKSQLIEQTLQVVSARPSLLNQLQLAAREQAGYASVMDAKDPVLCRALQVAQESLVVMFSLASASPSQQVAVTLGADAPVLLSGTGPTSYADVGNWCTGFFLAAICRDEDALEVLCQIPVDLLRRSSSRADDYYYLFAGSLQSFWHSRQDAPDLLEAALEATDPERLEIAPAEFVLNIVVPQMELLYRRMIGEAGAFNDALANALELHRKYWSKGERMQDPRGYLAVGPLAIASLAYESGMRIEVRSEYMPEDVMEGACG